MNLIDCPNCDGEGHVYIIRPAFNLAQMQVYPQEQRVECHECEGTGYVREEAA